MLVYANKHSAMYDLGKDHFVMLGEAVPSIFGTTPVRPDGKGFLLANAENDVSFVDWEGKESAIAMPDVKKRNVRLYEILSAPAVRSWSRWEGDVAIATSGQQQWRIDTAKKTAVLRTVDKSESQSDGKVIQQLHVFPDGKTKLAVIYLQNPLLSKSSAGRTCT